MECLNELKKKEYLKRLLLARIRILNNHPFYGLLLMNAKFGLDLKCETAYTDGKRICFSPKFLDALSDKEVEFILMHEIMHIVLKHCNRGKELNELIFNIACDIVVNSNILKSNDMDLSSITLKLLGDPSIHLAPNGKEGYHYTAEEVYHMLINRIEIQKFKSFDNHDNLNSLDDVWDERIVSTISAMKESSNKCSEIPLGTLRAYNNLINPKINWKEVLKRFLSKEICDYSFTPPDKRYEGDFFMPDFNEEEDVLNLNAIFVIDTSGSINEKQLSVALMEVKSAIDETNHLTGYILCLDAKAYDPIPINEFDINTFKALGGGGTSFISFFNELDELKLKMDNKLDLIIFMTDGYDKFPNENLCQGIPVLWIINNEDVTPPWGMISRIDANEYN